MKSNINKVQLNKEEEMQIEPLPQKKIKLQTIPNDCSHHIQGKPSVRLFCDCYTTEEVTQIKKAVQALKNYTKIIAVMIRHQQKSLSTLNGDVLAMFPQLKQRVRNCILRAHVNMNVLEQIIKDWQFTQQSGKQFQSQQLIIQHNNNHHHHHGQHHSIAPLQIIQIFQGMCKQWADIGNNSRQPLNKLIQIIKKYQPSQKQRSLNNVSLGKVIVQGSGMGRILYQLKHNFRFESVEGYDDRVLEFLCAEYFLYHCKSQKTLYPFLPIFINNYHTRTPYEAAHVPNAPLLFQRQPKSQKQDEKIIYNNFGDYTKKCVRNQYNSIYNIYISYLCTDRITNILQWIQIIYKNLKEGGIWINVSHSSFSANLLPMCYQQFREILSKTQFKIIQEFEKEYQNINLDISDNQSGYSSLSKISMVQESAKIYFIVLQK